ncbi:hypothetical protein ACPCG0_12645 [Propionibacteriaceae bacterium Y1923]|uniref:hypothetical protein n=1 Tax=Aestuariimicrobium sp. Y1814 TaxID=3418742 RepID=UPI003C231C58
MTTPPHVVKAIGRAIALNEPRAYLAQGLNHLVGDDWEPENPAVPFTLLAAGVERLLKVTWEAQRLAQGLTTTNAQLANWGHGLVGLWDEVHAPLPQDKSRWVGTRFADAETDPYLAGVVRVLEAWAASRGRYRSLAAMVGEAAEEDSPVHMWSELEMECLTDLGLFDGLLSGDQTVPSQTRARLAISVLVWWEAMFRCWQHGLVNADLKAYAYELQPPLAGLHPVLAETLWGLR